MGMESSFIIVFCGALLLGGFAGFLGVFAFLRQQSLLGDALSHAMLPGVAGAFLLTGSCNFFVLLAGALSAGFFCASCFTVLEKHTRLKRDAILGLLLSTFFGMGLVIITIMQKKSYAHAATIQGFFFGNAATIIFFDVVVMSLVGILSTLAIIVVWKEIQLFLFDPVYAATLGYPLSRIHAFITIIFIVTLALGLSIAGVILMSSLLIAPAAAARQWVHSVRSLCILSASIGAFSGGLGVLISCAYDGLPTGPLMVICLSVFVFGSLLFSPFRGAMKVWVR